MSPTDEPRTPSEPTPPNGRPSSRDRRRPRSRWLLLLPLGAVVPVTLAVALITPPAETVPVREQRPAPGFSLPELQDPTLTLSGSVIHGRPAVLNFWASWCAPCRREAAILEQADRTFGDQVTFLGIDHQDGTIPALEFLRRFHITYRSGYDPDGNVAPEFGLVGLPSTVFVRPDGEIIAQVSGPIDAHQLQVGIHWLLSAHQADRPTRQPHTSGAPR